jgi:squalene cyclase
VLVVLGYVSELDEHTAREGARWLASQQRPDGSFVLYPGASEGDIGATATAWAAFTVTHEQAEARERARAFVIQKGGAERLVQSSSTGDLSALFAAMAGVIDPSLLPRWPVSLLAQPSVRGWLERRINGYLLNLLFEVSLMTRALQEGGRRIYTSEPIAIACLDTYKRFQNPNGSFNELTMQTATLIATLHAAGYSHSSDRMSRALRWLKAQGKETPQGLTFSTFSSEIWATTHSAYALLQSGVSAKDERISRALSWVVEAQCQEEQVEQLNPGRDTPRRGGWAYQKTNVRLPDTDDTAVVLALLGEALEGLPSPLREKIERSHAQGVSWLIGMQNKDGGWAAFTRGHLSKKPGPGPAQVGIPALRDLTRFLRDLPAIVGDPSTEGLSGRVLAALGKSGMRSSSPEAVSAMRFLEEQQCSFGGWWGRWLVNYLPTTACVLLGLSAIQADLSLPWIQKAIRWLKSKQREDGGFGEDARSYADPSLAGEANQSMPGLTGLVVSALLAAGEAESEATRRAVGYLLATQRSDGTWPHHDWLAAYLPPRMFYLYPGSARFYPLSALGRYLACIEKRPHPTPLVFNT